MLDQAEVICEDLFGQGQNHVILFGEYQRALILFRKIYERVQQRREFLCSWHDASRISQPMDFFEPVLRLKYGPKYDAMKKESWFKSMVQDNVFQLAGFCGRENDSKDPNAQRLPVFFIDGLEELLFRMDFGYLGDNGGKSNFDFKDQPLSRGFGDCLRGRLHQTNRAIFYGLVRNMESIDYRATLGNNNYMFYEKNFRTYYLWSDSEY